MKKFLSIFCGLLIASLSMTFVSCSDDDEPKGGDIVGTWKEKSFEAIGITNYLQLRADGTAVSIGIYDDEWSWLLDEDEKVVVDYGKWSKNGDNITFIDDENEGNSTATIVKLTSNELGLSVTGVTIYYNRVSDSEVDKYLK